MLLPACPPAAMHSSTTVEYPSFRGTINRGRQSCWPATHHDQVVNLLIQRLAMPTASARAALFVGLRSSIRVPTRDDGCVGFGDSELLEQLIHHEKWPNPAR